MDQYQKTFTLINAANEVKRFHAHPTLRENTIAAHSWGVAMLTIRLHPNPSVNLIIACLEHDLAEAWTGDVPYTVKRVDAMLKQILDDLDDMLAHKWEFANGSALNPEDHRWLKYMDMVELVLYCAREARMGNFNMWGILRTQIDRLTRPETPAPVRGMVQCAVASLPQWYMDSIFLPFVPPMETEHG